MGSGAGELDGVRKFKAIAEKWTAQIEENYLPELTMWRSIFVIFFLIGKDAESVGYGNISRRIPGDNGGRGLEFIITASQTGHLKQLSVADYVHVTRSIPEQNIVYYVPGTFDPEHRKPSSETMTHFGVYDALPDANFVFHVHSKIIWDARYRLNIPETPTNVPYGTPAMAAATRALLAKPGVAEGKIMAMGGHRDGIVTWGKIANEAGLTVLDYNARAVRLNAPQKAIFYKVPSG